MYTCTTIYPLVILYMAVLRKLVHGRQDIKLQKPNTQLAPRKFSDNSPYLQILYKIGKRTTCAALPRFALTCTLYQRQNLRNPSMCPPELMAMLMKSQCRCQCTSRPIDIGGTSKPSKSRDRMMVSSSLLRASFWRWLCLVGFACGMFVLQLPLAFLLAHAQRGSI